MKSSNPLSTIVATVLMGMCLAHAGPDDKRLDIYWIDVEGGAATLIVTPAGECALVDTGLPNLRHIKRIQEAVTNVAGMKQIDHLIISHYDIDHYGGAAGLSAIVPIRRLYDNGKSFEGMVNDPGEDYFAFACDERIVVDPGDTLPLKSAQTPLTLKCIATRRKFVDPPDGAKENTKICSSQRLKDPDTSENRNSMVLVLQFGPFRFYNATDLTWNLEAKLVCPVNLVGEVDVCQVTHHGLDRSNNPLVLQSLKPTVTVMNNGRTKGCAPEVFANLKAAPSIEVMYQVHKNQRADGETNNTADEFIANTKDGSSGNYLKLSVAPDGKNYTVSIPATGHQRTFRTKS